jgi:hypothetical protein
MPPLQPKRLLLAPLLLCFLAAASGVRATSVTLAPVADTTLFETFPDDNLGGLTNFISGTTATGSTNRALIKFDIAGAIPSNAIIQQVNLGVTVVETRAAQPSLFSMHRMLADWGEGVGNGGNIGSPAMDGEATWFYSFFPDIAWFVPGAAAPIDFAGTASATQTIGFEGSYNFTSTHQLVADVQYWLTNAAGNFGWILVCEDEATLQTSRRFGSREDPVNFPTLTVEYSTQPHVILTPAADTSLFESLPAYNLGAGSLVSGTIGNGGRSRALIQFDIAANLPADAVIGSAALTLTVVRTPPSGSRTNSNFDLHRLLQPWGEGNKSGNLGQLADTGEATWTWRFYPTDLWSVPGAAAPDDFAAAVSSTQYIAGLGSYDFTNLAQDVQFWLTNSPGNFGWILISEDETTLRTAQRFGSREDPINSPTLLVFYLVPPRILSSGISSNQFHIHFHGDAGMAYTVERRDALSSPWTTLTNLPPQTVSGDVDVFDRLRSGSHFYRVGAQ